MVSIHWEAADDRTEMGTNGDKADNQKGGSEEPRDTRGREIQNEMKTNQQRDK